jgi:hypothetical protein
MVLCGGVKVLQFGDVELGWRIRYVSRQLD